MTSALFYLQYQSARNRLVSRFRRLRQPKYFFGAVVGAAWFYFYFFRVIAARRPQADASPEHLALLESIGAFILFVIMLLAWVVPHGRAALVFSEAEIAFLF